MSNSLPSEQVAVVAVIDPDVTAASTVVTAWIPAKNFLSFLATFCVGTLGTSATVDGKIEQASDVSGTGVKDVTGKAITQLTEAGTDSDKQALINIRQEELDVANGFDHIRVSLTVAVATSDVFAMLQGFNPRRAPASDNDVSTVDEIVS